MREGAPVKGLEQAFAAHLQTSPSMWSQIKSSRPIGDKFARQIEAACGKDVGWLDQSQATPGMSAAEEKFLDLALQAWRATNAEGRKQLKGMLRAVVRVA